MKKTQPAPAPDSTRIPLDAHVEQLETFARKPQKERDERIAAAQAALAPTVARSQELLAEVKALRAKYDERLMKLAALDWSRLRPDRYRAEAVEPIRGLLVRRVNDLRHLLGDSTEALRDIPDRVRDLKLADLAPTSFPARFGVRDGVYPIEPHRIMLDVRRHENITREVEEAWAFLEYQVAQLVSSLPDAPPEFVSLDLGPASPPRQITAENEFDPFAPAPDPNTQADAE